MKKESYEQKLRCSQFKKLEFGNDNIIEKNSSSLEMKRQELISESMCHRSRTIGAQPARLYVYQNFTNRHATETVLSIPGSIYHNTNKCLTLPFQNLPGGNVETTVIDARTELEQIVLNENEQIISLDVKILYTNVPVSEAIKIVLRCFDCDHATDIERSTLKFC